MSNTDQVSLMRANYLKLPSHIKNWLSSEQLVHEVESVAEKFNLSQKDISSMIRITMMMIFGEIAPANFLNELSHGLNISFQSTKMIGEEIINYMKPIENDLRRDLGLDIKLIRTGQSGLTQTAEQPASSQSESSDDQSGLIVSESPKISTRPGAPQQGPVVNLQSFQIRSDQAARPISPLNFTSMIKEEKAVATPPINPSAGSRREKEPEAPPTPFILHQETPTVEPSINPTPRETPAMKSNLTMKIQNFYQSSSASEKSVPRPISIKVETSLPGIDTHKSGQSINITKQDAPPTPTPLNDSQSESSGKHSASQNVLAGSTSATDQSSRVVHYSNLRTPINNVGLPKNIVEKDNILDLRKIIK